MSFEVVREDTNHGRRAFSRITERDFKFRSVKIQTEGLE